MKTLLHHLRVSLIATLALAILLCGIYPLIVWVFAQALFPARANGSLIVKDGQVRGSVLLAQNFTDPKYFHPRPSAAGSGYDAANSGGTNLGPLSDKLINGIHKKTPDGKDDPGNFDGVKDLIEVYRKENGLDSATPIPADAVTRSASGLDPHISLANALLQLPRVAKARGLRNETVQKLVDENTDGRDLGILGESGVNVVRL